MSHTTVYCTRKSQQQENFETWHTETLEFYKPVAKRIISFGLMDKKLLLVKVGLESGQI